MKVYARTEVIGQGTQEVSLSLEVDCSTAVTPGPGPGPVEPGPVIILPNPSYDLTAMGTLMEAFTNLDFMGDPGEVRLSPLGFQPTWQAPISGFERQNSSYRWTGAILAPIDGEYQFKVEVKSGGHVIFDGEVIWSLDREQDATSSPKFATVSWARTLVKGKLYPISFAVIYQGFLAGLTVYWKQPGKETTDEISALYVRPPADWKTRLKTFVPPPPEPSPFAEVDWTTYQSPDVPESLQIFPLAHPYNQRVDGLPVDPLSDKIITAMGALRLHPVFGVGGVGIPFDVVPEGAAKVHIDFDYAAESDVGPYPLPEKPVVEGGGGDKHSILVSPSERKVYELFSLRKVGTKWQAGSGAIFDLDKYELRPDGWTSADAAGLSIFHLLARYQEVVSGRINHAIRITVPKTRDAFTHPATHRTIKFGNHDYLPPMGCVFRLKSSYDLTGCPESLLPILVAGKEFGFPVSDNGGDFIGVCGAPDARWNDDELAWMKRIMATALEVVQMGTIITQV